MRKVVRIVGAAIVGTGIAATAASAQTGADFYKGKTVTYIVATAAGGASCLRSGRTVNVRWPTTRSPTASVAW